MRFVSIALLAAALGAANKPRLLVLTDITSIEAGAQEPDDGQSLIRLMLFANERR